MIEDNDFVSARMRTQQIRQKIETEYQRGVQRKLVAATKRQPPAPCSCPKEMHQSQGTKKHKAAIERGFDLQPADKASSSKPRADSPTTTAAAATYSDTESDNELPAPYPETPIQTAEETTPRTCSRCRNFKPPPKGKKLAGRENKARWTYVRQDAPDGDEREPVGHLPTKIVGSNAVSRDRDDEEQEVIAPSIAQPSMENVESASVALRIQNGEITANDSVTAGEPVADNDGQDSVAPLSNDSLIDGGRARTDEQTMIKTVDATVKASSAPGSASVASYFDIDLTVSDDDSDEVIVVKSEATERTVSKVAISTDDNIDEVKYELEAVGLEKRKLELEAKETRLRRKLARLEATKCREIKEEIKIEDQSSRLEGGK